MGRVKSTFVKTSGTKIYEMGKEDFTTDFDKNKEVVKKYADIPSKKLRNSIVGYITRLVKKSSN
jgi:small subunit ribosomal protein S17e